MQEEAWKVKERQGKEEGERKKNTRREIKKDSGREEEQKCTRPRMGVRCKVDISQRELETHWRWLRRRQRRRPTPLFTLRKDGRAQEAQLYRIHSSPCNFLSVIEGCCPALKTLFGSTSLQQFDPTLSLFQRMGFGLPLPTLLLVVVIVVHSKSSSTVVVVGVLSNTTRNSSNSSSSSSIKALVGRSCRGS